MRIVFLVHRFWPAMGGVEKYIHELASAFVENDHDITVITGAHERGLAERESRGGYQVRRYPAYRSPLRAWYGLLKLRQVFERADVVHISDVLMAEAYLKSAAWTLPRRSIFLTRHGLSYQCPVPSRERRRAARIARHMDGIVDDGNFIAKWLRVPASVVLQQGLSPSADAIAQQPEPHSNSAVFIGRLAWDSGITNYVDAIECLRRRHKQTVSLDVYGDGPLRSAMAQEARQRDLPVRFHGWVANAQERISDGCFAFVSGRLAIQEAMARRRLVVATWVNPLKHDYVAEEPFSPFIIKAGNADEIADRVAHSIQNPEDRATTVAAAFEHARTLTWRRTAAGYLSLWRSGKRSAPAAPIGWRRAALAMDIGQDAQ